jgi:hypothetical protein
MPTTQTPSPSARWLNAFTILLCSTTSFASSVQPQLVRVSALPATARPASVPLEFVVTPMGYFHASCVVQLDDGDEVQADGDVRRADGSLRRVATCAHENYTARGERRRTAPHSLPEGELNGWIASSSSDYTETPPAARLSANWVVPAAPSDVAGQVVFFFPGLESVPITRSIVQPVLGWDNYGDDAWTMANWNCCISGTVYTGRPFHVSPGDEIIGTSQGFDCDARSGLCKLWTITSHDLTTGERSTLPTRAFQQRFNWYFGGVLEVYGITHCAQYPASGSVEFSDVRFYDIGLNLVTPVWNENTPGSITPDCDYQVSTSTHETLIHFSTAP